VVERLLGFLLIQGVQGCVGAAMDQHGVEM
jgi:hypothetical protein